MKLNKKLLIVIMILFSSFLVSNVFALDSYGNNLQGLGVYQRIAGSYDLKGSITNETYVENEIIYVDFDYDLYFSSIHWLNESLATYSQVSNMSAVAIQVFQDEIYQNPLQIQFPLENPDNYDNFWRLNSVSELIPYSIDESAVCNLTYWINYDSINGSSWLKIDEFVFILEEIEGSGYNPPEIDENLLDLRFIYFWGLIQSCLLSPFLIASGIKLLSVKLSLIGVIDIILGIGFYMMLAG